MLDALRLCLCVFKLRLTLVGLLQIECAINPKSSPDGVTMHGI